MYVKNEETEENGNTENPVSILVLLDVCKERGFITRQRV